MALVAEWAARLRLSGSASRPETTSTLSVNGNLVSSLRALRKSEFTGNKKTNICSRVGGAT